ncbi:MAG: PAS domain-containing protein [Vicinamibacterales bacterium]
MSQAALDQQVSELVREIQTTATSSDAVPPLAIVRNHIDPLPVAALVSDQTGRYVTANQRAGFLTGYSLAELMRLSVWELTPGTDARDGETLWRAFLQQQRQGGEYRLLGVAGRLVSVRYAAHANVLPGLHLSLLEPV